VISGYARKRINRVLIYAMTVGVMLPLLFPVYWLLSTSFKTNLAAFQTPPQWLPNPATIENYVKLATGSSNFGMYVRNSLIVCSATAILAMLVASLAGYAVSRLRFPGKRSLLLVILATQMFPSVLILISLYVMFRQFHLIDTYLGLILSFTTFAVPFSVWMMKGFFDAIPGEIEEAALIDGCTRLQSMRLIALPLASPGLLAVGLFSFLDGWNNLLYPLTLATSNDVRTIPPGLMLSFLGQFKDDWAGMMAASVVVTVPVMIIFTFLQRYLVAGLTAGAVKG
jgi:multiple sugar transport system permease protein